MPGGNCAFPKCSTSRKDKGISLFKVTNPDKTNDEGIKCSKGLTDIILKDRVKDQSLKNVCNHINDTYAKNTLLQIKYMFIQHVKC